LGFLDTLLEKIVGEWKGFLGAEVMGGESPYHERAITESSFPASTTW
jgi:hypothetical protein